MSEEPERKRFADHLPNNVRNTRAPHYLKYMRKNVDPTFNADYSNNPLNLPEYQRVKFKQCIEHQVGDWHNAAIRMYTTNFCYQQLKYAVNNEDEAMCKEWGNAGNSMRTSVKYMYNNTGDKAAKTGKVYRGMVLTKNDIESFHPQDQFLWPPFVSSSRNEEVAKNFGNVIFEIDLDGPGLTYAVDVQHVSAYPTEEEVLFYPYSGFEVVEAWNPETNRIKLRTFDTLKIEKKYDAENQNAI